MISMRLQSIQGPIKRYYGAQSIAFRCLSTQTDVPKGFVWKEVRNHQGRTYYQHLETNERTWDKPEDKIFTLHDQAWVQAEQEQIMDKGKSYAGDSKVVKGAENTYDALVNSKSLYWAAFVAGCGYLGYVYTL